MKVKSYAKGFSDKAGTWVHKISDQSRVADECDDKRLYFNNTLKKSFLSSHTSILVMLWL